MKCQYFFQGLQKLIGRGFIDLAQPFLKVTQRTLGFLVIFERQSTRKPPVGFLAEAFRKVMLEVPVFVNRAPLMN